MTAEIDKFLDEHPWDLIVVCWVEKLAKRNDVIATTKFCMQSTMVSALAITRQMSVMGKEKK